MPIPRDPAAFQRRAAVDAAFFRREGRAVARDLLGTLLLVETPAGPVGGLVVETEAYVNGLDPASHLAKGRTPRTETFFSGPGTVYVYRIHGHHALNLISGAPPYPEGVLVRALEPTHGLSAMRERRGFDDPAKLAAGPGRLTEALGIRKAEFDDEPLGATRLSVSETDLDPDVAVSGRIGVSAADDWPLRYTVADSPFVSKPVPADAALDHAAVKHCYDRLAADASEALPIERESRETSD